MPRSLRVVVASWFAGLQLESACPVGGSVLGDRLWLWLWLWRWRALDCSCQCFRGMELFCSGLCSFTPTYLAVWHGPSLHPRVVLSTRRLLIPQLRWTLAGMPTCRTADLFGCLPVLSCGLGCEQSSLACMVFGLDNIDVLDSFPSHGTFNSLGTSFTLPSRW